MGEFGRSGWAGGWRGGGGRERMSRQTTRQDVCFVGDGKARECTRASFCAACVPRVYGNRYLALMPESYLLASMKRGFAGMTGGRWGWG